MTSIIAVGIPSAIVPFTGAAVMAGTVLAALLIVTATILIVADVRCAS
jgi:hypothetical protein